MTGHVRLVTANYPYDHRGGECMFVAPEVERLARDGRFRVTVAPLRAPGRPGPCPPGVDVDTRLAAGVVAHRLRFMALAWRWPGFGAEWRRALGHGGVVGLARVWRWAAQAQAVWQWAQATGTGDGPCIDYSYWRGGATLALARLAATRPRHAAITRVHGHDLYEARFSPPFQPWTAVYDGLALTLTVSEHGRQHLLARGVPADRLALSRLGTAAAAPARASDDGVLRVLSCSFMEPVKRVPLLATALVGLARQHPGRRVQWTHLGDGRERAAVQAVLAARPPNLDVHLAGHRPHADVLAYYGREPVDVFVLVSASEGLPVSVQEALAAGVPVVATDVGGVAEAVDATVGRLLPPTPDAAQVAEAIAAVGWHGDAAALAQRRTAARNRWAERFDAHLNHDRLANRLAGLLETL